MIAIIPERVIGMPRNTDRHRPESASTAALANGAFFHWSVPGVRNRIPNGVSFKFLRLKVAFLGNYGCSHCQWK
jgi:hypothetical protein